jgi:hypothetical protein
VELVQPQLLKRKTVDFLVPQQLRVKEKPEIHNVRFQSVFEDAFGAGRDRSLVEVRVAVKVYVVERLQVPVLHNLQMNL